MRAYILLLLRDWRGKELGLLISAILLATATITCIQLFSDRIQRSLIDEASTFLAGDAAIKSSQPFDAHIIEQAHQARLQTAKTIRFRAMLFNASNVSSIISVKAVDTQYPLKGELVVKDKIQRTTTSTPKSGEVWLAPRLLQQLNIKINDTVYIGEASFIVKAHILKEPDSAQSMMGISPRALISIDDIKKTGAVQQGSRINYTLTLSGDKPAITQFKRYIEQLDNAHLRWQDVRSANRNINASLDRAEGFLMLTGSLGVILCGLAIALAARRYATRQITHVAMLKTFGLTPQKIQRLYLFNFFALGMMGVLPGVLFGYLFHFLIIQTLDTFFTLALSAPLYTTFILSGLSGLFIFFGFALPPILKLKNVSPAAALHFDEHNNMAFGQTIWIAGFAVTLMLIYIYSQNIGLSVILLGGLVCCALGVVLCHVCIRIIFKLMAKKISGIPFTGLRLGIINIFRHRTTNSLQIFVFSTLLMLLFTLTLIRTQLINQWQAQIPEGTPNHFLLNIFHDDKKIIEDKFNNKSIEHTPFYPMTRGRLISINNQPITEKLTKNQNRGDNYERELNLTWTKKLGSDNTVIQGEWFNHTTENNLQVSAEEAYAKGLGLTIGDTLTFSVSGETVNAQLSSIRSVQWDSMNPNFYIIFNQEILNGSAATWFTSFYLPSNNNIFLTSLLKNIPTLSIIELDQVLDQVQRIVKKITNAVELLLFLVLGAGLLVLYSSIQASLDIRKQESAIIKTLGGHKKTVHYLLLTEFTILGLLSGCLATVGTTAALYFIQTNLMGLTYTPYYALFMIGPMLGALLIGTVGWISTRDVANTTPMNILRNL